MTRIHIKHERQVVENPDIQVPASKSISNRLLLINALHNDPLTIENLSSSEDTVLLKTILTDYFTTPHPQELSLDCQNAGTVFRFLTAFFSFRKGIFILRGSEAMKKRPVYPLVESLQAAGARIDYLEHQGYPPLKIIGQEIRNSIKTRIGGDISSQFISALILAGSKYGLDLKINNYQVSKPYIQMTLELLTSLGAVVNYKGHRITLPKQEIPPGKIFNEYDWSSAAPWYLLTSIMPVGYSLFIKGLTKDSIQGDKILARLFSELGVKTHWHKDGAGIEKKQSFVKDQLQFDVSGVPDIVPCFLAACAANKVRVTLTGISHLRHKESDRIFSMKEGLGKLGCKLEVRSSTHLYLHPCTSGISSPAEIDSFEDHRIAMAFAPLASRTKELSITAPDSVAKSYPGFWEELQKCGFRIHV
ncbi:MAG: hypothetical protein R6U19_05905 [Bacteroidales bacterium]